MAQEPMLDIADLKVKFDHHFVLNNVNFIVKRDETLAIIGPNGAGKTVLFRAMLGLIPYTGNIKWSPDARIGYVPQKLFVGKDIPLTTGEFLHLKEKNSAKVQETLTAVGLGESGQEEIHRGARLLKTRLGALSGGELQRILIAFALLGDPNVLLFDEPTSGVDISGEETVYSLISKLKKAKDLTIIFISHELQIVYRYADQVLCLNKEALCFGPPKKVIDKESLEALYGEEVHFYQHHTHHDH